MVRVFGARMRNNERAKKVLLLRHWCRPITNAFEQDIYIITFAGVIAIGNAMNLIANFPRHRR